MSIWDIIKTAGAQRETDTERNGFLSYHAETHAVAVGAGVAWVALVTGDMALLGVIIPAITGGLRAKNKEFGKILTDVYSEPHYALTGLVLGGLLSLPF